MKKISVFGDTYKIKIEKPSYSYEGLCDFDKRTIHVRKNKDVREVFKALYHEIYHAFQFRQGHYHDGTETKYLEREAEQHAQLIFELIESISKGFHDEW